MREYAHHGEFLCPWLFVQARFVLTMFSMSVFQSLMLDENLIGSSAFYGVFHNVVAPAPPLAFENIKTKLLSTGRRDFIS